MWLDGCRAGRTLEDTVLELTLVRLLDGPVTGSLDCYVMQCPISTGLEVGRSAAGPVWLKLVLPVPTSLFQ